MTPRKRWPNEAEIARIESLAAAHKGLEIIRPVLRTAQPPEIIRSAGLAAEEFYRIIENLQAVGPRTEIPGAEGQQPGKGTQVPHSFYQKRTQEP